MGMFDSLFVNCPHCGAVNEFQSKAGECILGAYRINSVPVAIAAELEGARESCIECKRIMILETLTDIPRHVAMQVRKG